MNVIVIVNDSLRADHLGCYGNKWIKTPNIDKLASEGAVFDYAYAEGLPTLPVRTAWFTGRFTFPFRGWQRLEPTDVVIAEYLWDKGYTSALFTDVYHMHKPGMAYERGFDYVEFIRGQEGDPYILDKDIAIDVTGHYKSNGKDVKVKQQVEQYLRNRHQWKSDEDHFVAQVMKAAMKWLEGQRKRDNLFLWVDAFDPHEPWDPPAPFDTMYQDPKYKGPTITHPIPGAVEGYLSPEEVNHIFKLYAGEVSLCDKWVGKFLGKIRDLGMWDNTLIIYTSDHGEPFAEHGIIRKAQLWPYEELVRIPLIVRHPKGLGAGKHFDAITETPDVMPTILDFLGVPSPGRLHGESLLPVMSGAKKTVRDYGYMGQFGKVWRVSNKKWCFILFWSDRESELYDLENDPEQKNNVAGRNPQVAMALELELRRFVTSLR